LPDHTQEPTVNLYLLSQSSNDGFDSYDSAVVAAPDDETARRIHPEFKAGDEIDDWTPWMLEQWAAPQELTVCYLGEAADGVAFGVVCASYNGPSTRSNA
jgi:hypothetical protein